MVLNSFPSLFFPGLQTDICQNRVQDKVHLLKKINFEKENVYDSSRLLLNII